MAEHAVQRDAGEAARTKQELDAVASIPEADARKALYFICSEDEGARRKVLDFYRVVPKTDVCMHCEKEFDRGNNPPGACRYHPDMFKTGD
ncbi:hypothetical protein LZ32DRAFT_599531 [Colletotrichum eremochloae]|nr:hypothetical protein LZ32DRAFT_599531 [Colletotrichum eremochloae]